MFVRVRRAGLAPNVPLSMPANGRLLFPSSPVLIFEVYHHFAGIVKRTQGMIRYKDG